MAALTAASWTVAFTDREIVGKKKFHQGTLALAATDTYPDNGIPLPTAATFGFVRNIDQLILTGVDATAGGTSDYHSRWDKANHKLLLYEEEAEAAGGALLEVGTSVAPGARTYNFLAIGW